MNRLALALALLLLAAPAAGQEADPEDARARARALVEGLTGYDEALSGPLFITVTLRGTKAIGKGKLTIARAPGDAVHAVYKAEFKVKMAFAGTKATQAATALLGADLGVLSYAEEETAQEGENLERSSASLELAGETWIFTRRQGLSEKTFRFPLQGANHQSLICGLVLARKLELDLTKPTIYRFSEIDWPDAPAEGEAEPMVTSRDIVMTVPEAAAYSHRGKTVQAYTIRAERGEQATVFVVDEQHTLLAFWPEGSPLRLIVGNEEQAGKDIAGEARRGADSKTPFAACALYVRVLSKQAPLDALDEILDYPALHAAFKKQNRARWERFEPDEFPAELKKQLASAPPLTKEEAEQFLLVLEETISGSFATVSAPNLPPFRLVKHPDGWKLTQLP